MGWEKRGNKFYYYDKKKINGKIVSIYCGQAVPDRILTKQAFNELLSKLSLLDNLFNLTKEQAIALLSSLPSYQLDFINNSFCQVIKENQTNLIKNFLSFPIISYLKLINFYDFFSINHKKIEKYSLLVKIIKTEKILSKQYEKSL